MAIPNNHNNSNSCYYCIKAVKWVPVLLIVTIIGWSYYAYVIQLCFVTVDSVTQRVFHLIFYHLFLFMLIWSYWKTIFTDIGRVPLKYKVSENDFNLLNTTDSQESQQHLRNISKNLNYCTVNIQGLPRVCDKCKIIRPDRAHHCTVCGECVLKMDHHCPWINNCVCFTNYKFFLLFLGYALIYCIFVSLTTLPYFISFWSDNLKEVGRFHILFLFFVAIMFGISLIPLFVYHCYLVSENRTTLEAFRSPIFLTGPDKKGFYLGRFKNFKQVFGDNLKTWFIPIGSGLGDGIEFPVNSHLQASTYHSMDTTQNSAKGDGTTFPLRIVEEDRERLLNYQNHEE